MKKSAAILIHLACWTLLLLYGYGEYLLKKEVRFSDLAFQLSMTTVQIIEFYICYLWVFPGLLKKNRVLRLTAGLIIAMGVFVLVRYLIEEVFYLKVFGFHNYSKDTPLWYYFVDNLYYGTSFIVLAGAVWGVQHSFKSEKNNSRLREEAKKAELAFLKSQINPHFLYNTMNYMYSLALPVSDRLSNAVLRMSDLMRYTLNTSPDGLLPVSQEIAYLESYIELFKMRFEPDFYVRFEQSGIAGQRIASLLLIPFVENAFKHGVVRDPEKPVRIILKIVARRLEFSVSNKISHAQKDHSSGIGLANIQRRLDLIYPDRHDLLISNNGQTYKVTLVIHLD
ncbi:histidine kinase [Pedobacter yulinensis]|uniref:Histidine kinase n=1 Tax=Pedobacter yulinensis TaxID=2126353 RepID=A0A2T3HQJ5_9SPHI|nr:histidine kinase [Pedobacter yulinensis]PST84657.1 histidine kinase [Pedobacter yulinensis]